MGCGPDKEAQALECRGILIGIQGRMNAWEEDKGSKPTMDDMATVLWMNDSRLNEGELPKCPAGGQYEILDGFTKPKCSVHGFN